MKRGITDWPFWFILLGCWALYSCSKSDFAPDHLNAVKVFSLDSQAQNMGLAQLNDQSLLLFGFADTPNVSRLTVNHYRSQVVKCDPLGNPLWVKRLPGTICDIWKILPIAESDFVVLGWSFNPQALCVARFNGNGELKWIRQKEYGADNQAYSIAGLMDRNGDLVVVAPKNDGIFLNKWDASGTEIYSQLIDVPLAGLNFPEPKPYHLAEDKSTGNLYIETTFFFGRVVGSLAIDNPILVQVTPTGSVGWIGLQTDSLNCYSIAGLAAKNGKIHSFLNTGKDKAGVIAYFPQTYGELIHETRDSTGAFVSREKVVELSSNSYFNQVLPTSDGGYLLTGTTNLLSSGLTLNAKMMVVKLKSDFTPEWKKLVDTRSQSFGTQSIETYGGSYFSSGSHVVGNKVQFQMLVKTK